MDAISEAGVEWQHGRGPSPFDSPDRRLDPFQTALVAVAETVATGGVGGWQSVPFDLIEGQVLDWELVAAEGCRVQPVGIILDRAEGDYYRRFVTLNGVSLVPYRRAANDAASMRGGAVR